MHDGPYLSNNKTGHIEWNSIAFNNLTETLFIDQPAGTPFSTAPADNSTLCTDEECVGRELFDFLIQFYIQNPYLRGRKLYIGGISYGGHYVPEIGGYILKHPRDEFNLKGLLILNGLTDIWTQMPSYPLFLYENNMIGITGYYLYNALNLICKAAYDAKLDVFKVPCGISFFIVYFGLGFKQSIYDITEVDGPDPAFEYFMGYMNDPEVQKALGVSMPFEPCSNRVYTTLLGDFAYSLSPDVALALDKGIKVSFGYGDRDFTCNWRGAEMLANHLEWSGKNEYLKQQYVEWKLNGIALGKRKKHKNLSLTIVYGAGHSIFSKQRPFAYEIFKDLLS